KIAELRKILSEANAAAVASMTYSKLFNAEERKALAADLLALQPDVSEMPPFIQSLMDKFMEQDKAAKEKYATFISALDAFEEAAEPITELHDGMKEQVLKVKDAATQQHMAEDARAQLLAAAATAKTAKEREAFEKDAAQTDISPIDFKTNIESLVAKLPEYELLIPPYKEALSKAMEGIPQKAETREARELIAQVRKSFPRHLQHVDESTKHMRNWQWDKPVPLIRALTAFLFGGDWITNSSWQDFYGVIPLLTGSLLIAITALLVALPLSVAAAIYTNQFASAREQEIIKPCIEFIQAIPSVVLGFIGISVLGDLIKETSNVPWLHWIPGFPVQERLNMFNAGLLLALMAIPTMFSLAEDAIQNVPRAFSEASEALGATKLQTVFRVIFPASISGVFAAMLLGLGRILGETMVVLLVAGNRIAIPDFSDGIGAVFQPAHTLTGIIAQELGEVSRGSAHWQALFMVGILLFLISLLINFLSRKVVKRFQLPKI
ncbi:MAG: phosphate transporter permease subunit PstC, partial [Verrucomicrobiota bacterium]